jgi:hypothetical protein
VRRARWLALVLPFLLAACGGGGTSEDDALATTTVGEARLALRATGELPDGVSADDIAIRAVEFDAYSSGDTQPIAAFELVPDGAMFEDPLELKIELPGAAVGPLFAMHVSSDGATEPLLFEPAIYDSRSDTSTYTAEITHFSRLFVSGRAPGLESAVLLPEVPRDRYEVGESFTVRASIRRIDDSWDYASRDPSKKSEHFSAIAGTPWSIDYTWYARGRGTDLEFNFGTLTGSFWEEDVPSTEPAPVSPDTVSRKKMNLEAGVTAHTVEQTFTCVRAGPYNIDMSSTSFRPFRIQAIQNGEIVGERQASYGALGFVEVTGRCVATDGATATPTATQTGVPTPTVSGTPESTTQAPTAPGGSVIPPVVLPSAPRVPTPVVPGQDLDGFIKVYAADGVWYDGSSLVVTPAHEPFCSYEHLHGGPIQSIEPVGGQLATITEQFGECGYGPSFALYWIRDPR